jgi:NAD(P)-dependent dehydrogenase (short-subunit alcohol dehydrogenase family)
MNMTKRLDNRVALITGGTSGIGAETARLFIQEGAKVVISGRSEEKGQMLSEELGENSQYLLSDVTKEEDIENSIKETVNQFGKLDILFNNAGGPVGAGIEKVTQKDIDYGVHLLLASVILGTKFAIEPMRKNGGGCIINNSSIAGIRYRQGDPLYAALKAGVTHYTRMSGVELGPDNIRVNSISPGAIATPIFWGGSQRANTLSSEENDKKLEKLKGNLAKAVPLNRSGLALDIAEAALYLASDAGSFVSCQDIVVDGGRTAMFNE